MTWYGRSIQVDAHIEALPGACFLVGTLVAGGMAGRIPFNRSVQLPGMEQRLAAALASGHLSGLGEASLACERILSERMGHPTLLCTSGTHALEMAALLIDVKPGDEVILPSFTFVSTANAFALRGATLRFADNDARGNIAIGEIERLLTPKTKAVVAVHYAGTSCDMDALLALCRERRVHVIEDAAQAVAASYKGRPLGSLGTLGCLSFHDTKNVSAGEGGALVVNDESLLARAEILREKGTNRRQFLQGLADKYTWVDVGSSYVLSDLSAAYLLPQLEQIEHIQARRKVLWDRYQREISLGERHLDAPAYNQPNHHLYGVVFASGEERTRFIGYMRERGIVTPFHYVALHSSPFGRQFHDARALPNCDLLSERLVRLPLFYNLSDPDQSEIIAAIRSFLLKN